MNDALAALRVAAGAGGAGGVAPEPEDESDDEPAQPPPPIVISEADFREKGNKYIHITSDPPGFAPVQC